VKLSDIVCYRLGLPGIASNVGHKFTALIITLEVDVQFENSYAVYLLLVFIPEVRYFYPILLLIRQIAIFQSFQSFLVMHWR